jgi:hypothetical protein
MNDVYRYFNHLPIERGIKFRLLFVLFGFMDNLASHLGRSPLIHSYDYETAGDRTTCFARLPIKSKSFMQYAG